MPTYEYKCLKCGKIFDHFQKITDAPLKRCITCRGKVQKLISAGTGLIFKGSGFYSTDYKASPKEKPPTADPKEKANKTGKNTSGTAEKPPAAPAKPASRESS